MSSTGRCTEECAQLRAEITGLLRNNNDLLQHNNDLLQQRFQWLENRDELKKTIKNLETEQERLQERLTEAPEPINLLDAIIAKNPKDSDDLKVDFDIMLHRDDEKPPVLRMCKLDTGSPRLDLIATSALNGLNPQKREYNGPPVIGIGADEKGITPTYEVEIGWHVRGREKTYQNWFTVWDEDNHPLEVDVLLGRTTIAALKFLLRNTRVYHISHPRPEMNCVSRSIKSEKELCAECPLS